MNNQKILSEKRIILTALTRIIWRYEINLGKIKNQIISKAKSKEFLTLRMLWTITLRPFGVLLAI